MEAVQGVKGELLGHAGCCAMIVTNAGLDVAAAPYKYAGPVASTTAAQELNATVPVYEVEGNGTLAPSGGQGHGN